MSSAPTTPSFPLVRECPPGGLRPLLVPGGRDNYFSVELQRMMFAGDEPLARFLPPAKWQMGDRSDRNRHPQINYVVPDEIIKTARPLTTLPQAEIDAFVQAVTVFASKGRPNASGVTPFLRQCHSEFRLPDPSLEPESYWVYGSEFDRRLLILWGAETQSGTSLTLDKVAERIQRCAMAWRDKQELGLKLARNEAKLGRFLAQRLPDGGLHVGGITIPAKKLKRLNRIAPSEWRAFEEAAQAYYVRGHEDQSDVPPFEKELRKEFRLPGPQTIPGDFYRVGSHFVIAADSWTKESTLALTTDEALGLPERGPDGVSPAETVSGQLKLREQPPYERYLKIGGGVAAAAVIGLAVWIFRPDTVKPQLVQEDAAMAKGETTVVLTFSEPVVLPKQTAKPADGDGAGPFVFHGNAASVNQAQVDLVDPHRVVLVVSPALRDGEKYGLSVTNVTDRSGNVIDPASAEFTYYDTAFPELKADDITADGTGNKRLLLTFTKPISENALTPNNFAVYDGTEGGRRVPLANVVFDPEVKNHTAVLLEAADEFIGNKWYRLELGNVTDTAVRPNRVKDVPEAKRRFQYTDKRPPRLREVVATGGEFQVELQFSKPIDKALATDIGNYEVLSPAKQAIPLVEGGATLNDAGDRVTLKLRAGKLSAGQHQLRIRRMAELKGGNPINEPIERSFQFNDGINPTGPKVKGYELADGNRRLRLEFDRTLARDGDFDLSKFHILDRDKRPTGIEVRSVQRVADALTRITVELSRAPGPGQYFVEASGVEDVFGTAQETPVVAGFIVRGIATIQSQLIDWQQMPLLRDGRTLVLTFSERITKESAADLTHYRLAPTQAIARLVEFKPGTEELPATTVILELAKPCQGPLSITVDGVVIEAARSMGPQSLPPRSVQPVF